MDSKEGQKRARQAAFAGEPRRFPIQAHAVDVPWPLAIAVGIFICYNVRQNQEGKLRGIRESHTVKEKTMVGHSHFSHSGTAKAEGDVAYDDDGGVVGVGELSIERNP